SPLPPFGLLAGTLSVRAIHISPREGSLLQFLLTDGSAHQEEKPRRIRSRPPVRRRRRTTCPHSPFPTCPHRRSPTSGCPRRSPGLWRLAASPPPSPSRPWSWPTHWP